MGSLEGTTVLTVGTDPPTGGSRNIGLAVKEVSALGGAVGSPVEVAGALILVGAVAGVPGALVLEVSAETTGASVILGDPITITGALVLGVPPAITGAVVLLLLLGAGAGTSTGPASPVDPSVVGTWTLGAILGGSVGTRQA